MSLQDLKAKYGGSKSRQAINRAIRAECPGGPEALDALELLYKMSQRHGRGSEAEVGYLQVLGIVDAMEDVIRERYGMPERAEREDGRR